MASRLVAADASPLTLAVQHGDPSLVLMDEPFGRFRAREGPAHRHVHAFRKKTRKTPQAATRTALSRVQELKQ